MLVIGGKRGPGFKHPTPPFHSTNAASNAQMNKQLRRQKGKGITISKSEKQKDTFRNKLASSNVHDQFTAISRKENSAFKFRKYTAIG